MRQDSFRETEEEEEEILQDYWLCLDEVGVGRAGDGVQGSLFFDTGPG